MSDMNIFQRMSAITKEINNVAKNLSVGTGKSAYKAVGEADVLAAVKPAEEKYGVYSYPYDREIIETAILTTTSEWDGKVTEKKNQFLRVRTVYRFVNVDKQDEYIDITTFGDGVDSQDKAPGKAMTYADKYALLKAYKIITGDDPDQKYSDDMKDKEQKTPMASDKQVNYISKLIGNSAEKAAYANSVCNDISKLTTAQATEIIAKLKEWK